jgi:hypothetical protein
LIQINISWRKGETGGDQGAAPHPNVTGFTQINAHRRYGS